ncbi:MAG: hypothetical protein AB7T22_03415 [Calditrichaceae bacterium]
MAEINLKSENGVILPAVIAIIAFLTVLAGIISMLVSAENKMQIIDSERQRTLYAAQSGLEYSVKHILKTASTGSWSEYNLDTGLGTSCDIDVTKINSDTLRIMARGRGSVTIRELELLIFDIDSSDVSRYSIYAAGNVKNVETYESQTSPLNEGLIVQNTTVMPVFDLDELRSIAQTNGTYYSEDLKIAGSFSEPSGSIIFVEDDLELSKVPHWSSDVHFVVLGDIDIDPAFNNESSAPITFYLPDEHSDISVSNPKGKKNLDCYITGGIITNGSVDGSYKNNDLVVYRDQDAMRGFLAYSLNEGPMVLLGKRWKSIL